MQQYFVIYITEKKTQTLETAESTPSDLSLSDRVETQTQNVAPELSSTFESTWPYIKAGRPAAAAVAFQC